MKTGMRVGILMLPALRTHGKAAEGDPRESDVVMRRITGALKRYGGEFGHSSPHFSPLCCGDAKGE
jgi:hypothetical protein